jgi:hypothetical protein
MKIYDLLTNENYKNKKLIEKLVCIFENIDKSNLSLYFEKEISQDILDKIDNAYNEILVDKKPLEYVL